MLVCSKYEGNCRDLMYGDLKFKDHVYSRSTINDVFLLHDPRARRIKKTGKNYPEKGI
jgi:hypothetical protein